MGLHRHWPRAVSAGVQAMRAGAGVGAAWPTAPRPAAI